MRIKMSLKKLLYSILLVTLVLIAAVIFLLSTTPGLYLVFKTIDVFLPGHLEITGISGRLRDHFSFNSLKYSDNEIHVTITNFELDWQLNGLLHRTVLIRSLQATRADVQITRNESLSNTTRSPNNLLKPLPLNVQFQRGSINHLTINTLPSIDSAKIAFNLNEHLWDVTQLDAEFAHQQIVATGSLSPNYPYSAVVTLKTKPLINKNLGINGQLKITGDYTHYQVSGTIKKPNQLKLAADIYNGSQVESLISWQHLQWPLESKPTFETEIGQLKINGTIPNLTMELSTNVLAPLPTQVELVLNTSGETLNSELKFSGASGNANLIGSYNNLKNPKINGTIRSDLQINDWQGITVSLKSNGDFKANSLRDLNAFLRLTGQYNQRDLQASVRYDANRTLVQADIGSNHFKLTGNSQNTWQIDAKIMEPQSLHPSLQGLKTTVSAQGNIVKQMGKLDLTIDKGSWQASDKNEILFAGGYLHNVLNSRGLDANGQFVIDNDKRVSIAFNLPQFSLDQANYSAQKINGSVNLFVNNLDFLSNFSQEVKAIQGQLKAELLFRGTVAKPDIKGLLQLDKASATFPALNTTFNPINLTLDSQGTQWNAKGELYSKDKPMLINASGSFSPTIEGHATVTARDFLLVNTDAYQLYISPDLDVVFNPERTLLTGNLLVPTALVKPQAFTDSVSLSDDAIFVGKKEAEQQSSFDTNITVVMGQNVKLAVKGLNGFLDGQVQLQQTAGTALTGNGALSIREGKYQAYGQDLVIDTGSLTFTGGLIENPGIQLRAVRQFNNSNSSFSGSDQLFDFDTSNLQSVSFANKTTVGIEVTGRLAAPKVQLYSSPATLSQADILSMLLLGRPASQASKSGAQILFTAISQLNLSSGTKGTQLLSQLRQKLGLEFGFANNTEYNQKKNEITDGTSFYVGKSLSPRLHLSYNVGIQENDGNTLTLKYLLNKFFSIQVNASMKASGLDFLYTRQLDR